MKHFLYYTMFFLFTSLQVTAQDPYYHAEIKRSTGNSGTGANIDVKYHRFEWYLNPDGAKNIQGSVTTYFVTTQNNVKTINFDLNKTSFNNSNLVVKYHGNTITHNFPASGNVNILNITLPANLPNNRLDSVTIFYSGAPPAVSGQAEGFQQKSVNGSNMYYTLSESYEDKDWWPCKADMQDKVDSIDFIITTPSAFRAAANGVLIKETTSGANKIYHFKHRYPIASYLVAVAVAKYRVFDRGTVNISGTEVPIDYYITEGRGTNPTAQLNAMDFVKLELVAFSEKFGDYPFKNEKYGMYEFGWGGGMEHQTFSAMGWSAMSSAGTIAHELMHQWFGDKVTFATWEHLWLAEGFAKYGEALAAELVPSLGVNPASKRLSSKNAANSTSNRNYGCIIPKATIANSTTIWSSNYGTTVYERGAMVVSMLRILVGDDKFFQACRNYLNDPLLAYGSAVTDDLQRHFEAVLDGFDLTPFFDSWVRGNGYSTYSGSNSIKWWPTGNGMINIGVGGQTKSTGSNVTHYYTPIPIRVQGAGGKDTILVVYDQNGVISKAGNGISTAWGPVVQFDIGFEATTVTFDPFSMGLSTGTVTKQQVLALNILDFEVYENKKFNKAVLHIEESNDVQSIVLEKGTDGIQFEEAGRMKKGLQNQYVFEDDNSSPVNFYRAKITDIFGKIIYSKTIKISGHQAARFAIINNPVSGSIKIKPLGQFTSGTTLNFQIFDISGKKHLEKNQKVNGGLIEIKNKLKSGTYFLKISGAGQLESSLKFIAR